MKKFSWFKLSQIDTGNITMTPQELQEAYSNEIPQGAKLSGVYWRAEYTPLALPMIVDTNKILISVLKNKRKPEEVASAAYAEAFNISQKALNLAKKLNTTNPSEIQKYLYENLVSGIAYDPTNPYAKKHEELHREGGKKNIETVIKELAAELPNNINEKEKMFIAKYFVDNWINNVMKLYSREEWEDEFYAMYPQMKKLITDPKQLQIIRNNILSQMPQEED